MPSPAPDRGPNYTNLTREPESLYVEAEVLRTNGDFNSDRAASVSEQIAKMQRTADFAVGDPDLKPTDRGYQEIVGLVSALVELDKKYPEVRGYVEKVRGNSEDEFSKMTF